MVSVNKYIQFFYKRKTFIFYFVMRALVMLLSLITNIIIVRKLSVNDFGIFSIANMLIGLITTFGFSWSSSSILYYGSREKSISGSINKTFWARNIIIIASLLVTTVLFILLRNQINEYVGLNVSFLILCWLYVMVVEDYLIQYFLTVKKQVTSSMLSFTAKVVYLITIIVFHFDVQALIMLNILSHATVLVYILKINSRDIDKFEFDKSWFKEILNFSLWQLFGFSGLYLINFGDTAVIKYFMTNEEVGIYNAAYKLFNAIASFAFIVSSFYAGAVTEYFANNKVLKIRKFFYKERLVITGLSTAMHVIVILFSKQIILTLYGEAYRGSIMIFNVLMIGSMLRYFSVFYMLYYNTNKKYKLQQSINILRAVLNIVLDVIFINLFGLIGPAIATTLSIFVTLLISYIYCEKRIQSLIKGELEKV